MYEFPHEPKKIAATIKRYERSLRKEQEDVGTISDGYGKRYLLGTLYLLLGDTPGAMKSFDWFGRTFADDGGEPFHSLSWTLALYRSGRKDEASKKLRQTMLLNLYMIPRLLDLDQERFDMWHTSNWSEKGYLDEVSPEVFRLWDAQALEWARKTYDSIECRAGRARWIEIHRLLQKEPVGLKRAQLVNESSSLQSGDS